jgi:hypothetical protein
MNRDVHDHIPDERSDEDPHLHPKGCPSGDNQQMGQTGVSHQFTGDTHGKRQNDGTPYRQELYSVQRFHVVFCICCHFAGGGDQ